MYPQVKNSMTQLTLIKGHTGAYLLAMKMSRSMFVSSAQKNSFWKRGWASIEKTKCVSVARRKSIVTYAYHEYNSNLQPYLLGMKVLVVWFFFEMGNTFLQFTLEKVVQWNLDLRTITTCKITKSQIILRSNVLRHYFSKVAMEYSTG